MLHARGPLHNTVLATTTFSGEHVPWIEGAVIPVLWKRRWAGAASSTPRSGHIARDLEVSEAETLVERGVLWASRREGGSVIENGPVRVGVMGAGKISGIYPENGAIFHDLEVVSCADLLAERAEGQAREYGVPNAYTPEELLADPEVEIVPNLTVPAVHAEVSLAALEAGKHLYTEKPLAVSRENGRRMLEVATERGLLIGCAPDTFLGGGLQTCRKVMDEGIIGETVAATAVAMTP